MQLFKVQCFYQTNEVPGYWRRLHHTSFETFHMDEAARMARKLNKVAQREGRGDRISYETDPALCLGCGLPSCECEPDLF